VAVLAPKRIALTATREIQERVQSPCRLLIGGAIGVARHRGPIGNRPNFGVSSCYPVAYNF